MKFAPPFTHGGADELQPDAAGTNHCVSHTRSLSSLGAAGGAVVRLASFIVTRRHACRGWHDEGFGQLTFDERMSRFGMVALVVPKASYVASPAGSVAELSRIASPFGCCPAYTPVPPI